MEADFNRKGISIYAGRIGQRIAPKGVTIVDDGTNPHLRGSINIDDEGAPAQRTVLVENGILRSYLHDRISARALQGRGGPAPAGASRSASRPCRACATPTCSTARTRPRRSSPR